MIPCKYNGVLESGAMQMTCFIEPNTAVDAFDEKKRALEESHGYELTFGGRCGWNVLGAATITGNIALIEHIVRVGGKDLMDYANIYGNTALHIAAYENDFNKACLISKKLIQLGAQINICSIDTKIKNRTPLIVAANKSNLQLVKLLLKNGAIVPDNVNEQLDTVQQKIIFDAIEEINQQKKAYQTFLAGYLKPQMNDEGVDECLLKMLPPEMMHHIWTYLKYDPDVVNK